MLSAYGLFVGQARLQRPAEGVIPYDVNSALFSDYSHKHRFIKLPPHTSARYHPTQAFELPIGTILAKTFSYPRDAREPERGERLIETRIMKHEADGWVGLPYVWNDDQTDAHLKLAGGSAAVRWIDDDGAERSNSHMIPNANQCKGCHKQGAAIVPLGVNARQWNRDYAYSDGVENQLARWSRTRALRGVPPPAEIPRLAVWDDSASGSVEARARAWLEVNCAHCHNPHGPAGNSGLDLMAHQSEPVKYGVYKAPVAAGRGSGQLEYDIVPGHPDQSILVYRIASTEPQVMMPELGKRLVHTEGVALVRQWVTEMKD
jgi:uncharacterized repeat protein (TIGR03806 family)